MGAVGLETSNILTELFIPTTTLSFLSVISRQRGAESSFMVSRELQLPVEGSQKRMVLSYEPLASLRLICQLYNSADQTMLISSSIWALRLGEEDN